MGRYGKNMRDCCDSPAQRGSLHVRGCPSGVAAIAADQIETMRQARLWIAGQPYTMTSRIATRTEMVDALTKAIGEPLEGWE
jgi:hypothetical protein